MYTLKALIESLCILYVKSGLSIDLVDFELHIVEPDGKIVGFLLREIPPCFDCRFNRFVVNKKSKLIKIYMGV